MQLTFEIPVPPSLNNAYMTVSLKRGRTRRVPTERTLAFKVEAGWRAREAACLTGWEVNDGDRIGFSLLVWFGSNRRTDIDNRIKLALDAIAEALGFDDSVVDLVVVQRAGIDRANPRAVVTLTHLRPQEVSHVQ